MLGSMALERQVIDLAAHQGGFVTRNQLVDLGQSPSSIDRSLRNGDLAVVSEGVYRALPTNSHADLIRGALLALPSAVASHESAAHLLEFPVLPPLVPTVVVHRRTTHRFPGVTVRRCDDLRSHHLTSTDGILTTTVARTVFDLGGILDFDDVDRIAEALLIDRRLKIRHLENMTRELARRGKRGSTNVREFLRQRSNGLLVGPTALERRGRRVLADAGLPAPVAEYPIPWDTKRRFDDAYPRARLALEWDSRRWHSQLDQMETDRHRDHEAALHGWVVLRFTWADVTERPDYVASAVGQILGVRSV
ncbi:MAG: hypothetical protein WB239_01760 [Acidimicrobiia bacterium]